MVLADSDADDVTAELEVISDLCVISSKVDILDEHAALVGVVTVCPISALTHVLL